jgi:hypothetical protein
MGAGMRCLSCDAALTDFESTRKSAFTGEYIDLCNHCFATINDEVQTIDRADLALDSDEIDDDDANHCGLDIDEDY